MLDPFAGSGTTGLAAVDLDVDCTLIEKGDATFADLEMMFSSLGLI